MDTEENDIKLMREACERLGEHFDTVQIFTTRHEHGECGGTKNGNWGSGNWYARFGQVSEWIHVQREQSARDRVWKEKEL